MLDNDNNNNINNWLLWLWSFWYQILAVLLPIRSFLVTRYSVTYVDIVAILTELMFGCVLFHAMWPDLQWQLTFLINPNIIEKKTFAIPGVRANAGMQILPIKWRAQNGALSVEKFWAHLRSWHYLMGRTCSVLEKFASLHLPKPREMQTFYFNNVDKSCDST